MQTSSGPVGPVVGSVVALEPAAVASAALEVAAVAVASAAEAELAAVAVASAAVPDASAAGPGSSRSSLRHAGQRRISRSQGSIGDAGAVAMLLAPHAVRTKRLPVRVELTGTWTRGRTVVDRRDWSGDMAHDPHGLAPATVDVALEANGPWLADLWLRTVSGAWP